MILFLPGIICYFYKSYTLWYLEDFSAFKQWNWQLTLWEIECLPTRFEHAFEPGKSSFKLSVSGTNMNLADIDFEKSQTKMCIA